MPPTSKTGLADRLPLVAWLRGFFLGEPSRYDERAFVSGLAAGHDRWGRYEARVLRYARNWAMYEGTVFQELHRWSEALKERRDLYEAIRAIRSPCKRIVDFFGSYVYQGSLDLDAGDGTIVPTAIPIVTANEAIRPVLGRIWRDSRWQVNKDNYPRECSAKGDAFLQAVDDPTPGKEKAYFVIRDPATVYGVVEDAKGNLDGYTIVERRPDPESPLNDYGQVSAWATYIETCDREPDGTIRYRTYRNSVAEGPYDWQEYPDGTPDGAKVGGEWTQPYGFVPMVHVQHKDVGKGWGWSAYQGSEDKLFEIDDQASKVNDQVRVLVDPLFAVDGAAPGQVEVAASGDDGGYDRARQRLVYIPAGSKITPMVANLDIAAATAYLKDQDEVIAADFPFLTADEAGLNASGRSREVAREKVESDVVQIRSGVYDPPLVAIHKMVLSIGASKRYPGFEAIPPDAYEKGLLDHSIGDRPVFAVSRGSKLAEVVQQQAIIAGLVNQAGMPLESACRLALVPDDEVAKIVAAKAAQDAATAAMAIPANAPATGNLA